MRDEVKAAIFFLVPASLCLVAFLVYHPVGWSTFVPQEVPAPERLNDDPPPARFDQFIARYGPPTFEEPSPRGNSQPPLFTKWLDYEPERVRIAFVSATGAEPASLQPGWTAISFVDAAGTQPISAEEAGRRLKFRHDSAQSGPEPMH